VDVVPRYAPRRGQRHRRRAHPDKGLIDRADTCHVRSGEADRVDETSVWPDDALQAGDEPDDDGLDELLQDAQAAAKVGAARFAEEFRRREANEVKSPTFPPHPESTPVDAAVEAHAID
jgi:MoxR-like ATPase